MVAATGQMAIAAAIYPKLPYHPTRDFIPISMIANFPLILAGPADDKIKTVKDLVAYGKAIPTRRTTRRRRRPSPARSSCSS
jgi:tripartite-type tricarboxylate transporter receptor subunit TctC